MGRSHTLLDGDDGEEATVSSPLLNRRTPTPHTGDDNRVGPIRQGEGFGLGEFAFVPAGIDRLESMRSQLPARTMGDTGPNVGSSANIEAGGPRSPRRPFSSVIVKGALRGAVLAQAVGRDGASLRTLFVEFGEVVSSRGSMPGGFDPVGRFS